MIHLLEVGPELSQAQLRKLSRRYAMTGGYELALKSDLTVPELGELVDKYIPELGAYSPDSALRRSNNAYRILKLVVEYPGTPADLRERVEPLL